ncbi:hypothetical protein KFK14_17550 [Sphingobium phenoxybenzoativorans]|uniref:ParB/Sulfiredoxin domain-containing protein n=1 Tax=Sphingobium phenoxybenzoativorans TaxID=1592790 RepID=A0A975K7D7_9SPHN|nr:DUF6551 family protein [Sphingobium phenoxybenzoativorans]QUT04822.1 hypothetical protein KFK14_17550 [Sphingobium phenoxybenzoativorans]
MRAYMVGERQPNGTFLIKTKRGQARVHVGFAAIERNGEPWTMHPDSVKSFVAELEEGEAGYGNLPRTPSSGPEAEVAPRDDDTDEITRRIRASSDIATRPQPKVKAVVAISPQPTRTAVARKAKFAPPLGMPPSIENRNPAELNIDDGYQRSIDTGPSKALIERIARSWDWRMCLPLVVSKRDDGSLWVIDGQHRHAAAMLRGDISYLPCCVGVYGSVADEAAMFVAMNRARRAINRLDDFHAAQAGGDAEALQIAELIEAAGFTVSRKTGVASWVPGEVAFTSAIGAVLRKHGAAVVSQALDMMAKAFPGERLVAGSPVFTALCRILVRPPDNFDPERLAAGLRTFDMKGWASFLAQAKGGDERAQRLRETLLMAYDDAGRVNV